MPPVKRKQTAKCHQKSTKVISSNNSVSKKKKLHDSDRRTKLKLLQVFNQEKQEQRKLVAEQESTSDFSIITLDPDSSKVLLAINNHSQTHCKLHGCAKLTSIKGLFSINGFLFEPGSVHRLFAPLSHPAAVLRIHDDEKRSITSANTHKNFLHLPNVKETIEKFDVVILFETMPVDVLPGFPDLYILKPDDVESSNDLCSGCWSCETERCFNEHECYKDSVKEILTYDSVESRNLVVVTTGGKNVGKSTFNRYLINRLLNRFPSVYYLECDVGQTEFTPAGMLAINKIDCNQPLLGPPHSHQQQPVYSCFYGNNTPAGDPDGYIDCMKNLLMQLWKDLRGKVTVPIIVNTMGWNRALGLQLLVDTIRITQPSHVMQFSSDKESKNITNLSNEFVCNANGWATSTIKLKSWQKFKHLVSCVQYTAPKLIKYMAPDLRNMALLNHLANLVASSPEDQHSKSDNSLLVRLQRIKPYRVSVNTLKFYNATSCPIRRKHLYRLLNTAVVGLCSVSDDIDPVKDEELLRSAPATLCLGLGVIRGVDPEQEELFIVTSLAPDVLDTVNCVICGNLYLPDILLLKQRKVQKDVTPYVTSSYPYETVGAGMFRVHRKFSKFPSSK